MRKIIVFLMMLVQIGFSQDFDVYIRVENVTDLIGMSMYISYDPTVVEVPDNNPNLVGTQIESEDLGFLSNGKLLASLQKDVDGNETQGILVIGYSSTPPLAQSGEGDCFTVRFNKLTAGNADFNFLDKSNLQNMEGEIESEWYVENIDRSNDVARVVLDFSDPTGIELDGIVPLEYKLNQNYPNPLNSTTVIEYTMESKNHVVISIFDVLGRECATIVNDIKNRGIHRVTFNSDDLSSGTYYYYMSVGNKFIESKKMVIIK